MDVRQRRYPNVLRGVFLGVSALAFAAIVLGRENVALTEGFRSSDFLSSLSWGPAFLGEAILMVVATLGVVVLGERAIRKHRAPGAWIWALALLPFVVALPIVLWSEREILENAALAHAVGSGPQLLDLLPEVKTSFWLVEGGAAAARWALFLVGVAGVISIFSVDPASLSSARHRQDPTWMAARLTGLIAVFACVLGGVLVRGSVLEISFSDVFCLLSVLLVALASVRTVRITLALSAQDEPADVAEELGILVTSTLAFSISAVLGQVAAAVYHLRNWLYFEGAESIDYSIWAERATQVEEQMMRRGALMLVYAACALCVLALPEFLGRITKNFRELRVRATLVTIALALVLGSLFVWRVNADFAALATPMTIAKQQLARQASAGDEISPTNAFVLANGEVLDRHISGGHYDTYRSSALQKGVPEIFVVANKKAPFDVVVHKLKATFPAPAPMVVGIVAMDARPSSSPRTSGIWGLVDSHWPAHRIFIQERLDEPLYTIFPVVDKDPWAILVLPDGDSARIALVRRERARQPIGFFRVPLPPKPVSNVEELLRSRGEVFKQLHALAHDEFRYRGAPMVILAPIPGTSLGEVLAILDRFPVSNEHVVLTTDREAIEEALRQLEQKN